MITSFVELPQARLHSTFGVADRRTGEALLDHLELHFIELPKLRVLPEANDEPALLEWAKFLNADTDDELEALAMQSPVLKRAKDALDTLSADEEARMRAEQRETAFLMNRAEAAMEREAALAEGHAEGLAKGHAEGLAKGHAEGLAEGRTQGLGSALRLLLAGKFGAITAEAEQRLATAGEAELKRWTARVFAAKSIDDVLEGG